jgi:Signal recognition particle 14kD protein
MVYLEADRFLNELGKLYEKSKTKGSVNIVFKRSKYPRTEFEKQSM